MNSKIIRNEAEPRTAEVLLYDVIGEDLFGGISGKAFADQIANLGEVDTITLRINSPGGNVFDGNAIYNALKNHPARVVVNIEGIAASAASYIAMAGDEIIADENAILMIHQAQGFAMGPESEMRKMADTLDKLDGQISKTYADRTNRKPETFMKAMIAETWYTAEEAKEARLVDSVRANKKRPAANFSPEVFNRISKRPDKIAALLTPEDPPADLNAEDEPLDGPLDAIDGTGIDQPLGVSNAKPPVSDADLKEFLASVAARAASLKE